MQPILNLLPQHVEAYVTKAIKTNKSIEEIRLRINQPVECLFSNITLFSPTSFTEDDASMFLNQLSSYSLYAFEEELQKGYITIEGGHRVGLAGKTILENGKVKTIRPIRSFNIRVAKQKIGVSNKLVSELYDGKNGWRNTLIIGAPQTGKTTLLRDLARNVSTGTPSIPASKVAVVDERSEIAGCMNGTPQHDLGTRTDVLDGCPKAEGMMMMIRSMSPQVMIVDEIGREEDAQAILEARHAGVVIMATAHGFSFEEIAKRPIFKQLLKEQAFDRVIEVGRTPYPGVISKIRIPTLVEPR
ncbi:stage III sporulation protein AA [Shouchella lehensis]|uniref:Stage III sporulation protein AA n=2 Tax=Shouchella lehensis TaxID=300825 RepID=A0A060M4N8_9BACI|nr:stage III sporulation protein AA [Shouchella lehensis]AIC95034.1 stage III sporulation protein AA [Shouchella lehensis G1]MBG9784129.1 stage III sporulation protein AA [Shouchella lehensis]RQW20860.1 stage III sporulation protein AA [Bacillus sp. C1-1]TES50884.1 stage III sporulation protein AA [Shouchella lehensis]